MSTETENDQSAVAINPADEQKSFDAFRELLNSPGFHGFCGCKHAADEAGILWNDSGHRTQIERAIWILAALEPAGEFMSLWAHDEFRKGFYLGLWEADYVSPYNNPDMLLEKALYVSHFFDPDSQDNIVPYHYSLRIAPIVNKYENAWTMTRDQHFLAAERLDKWRESGNLELLEDAGRCLGRSTHYFTDLTQPMHASHFAEFLGSRTDWFDQTDKRHSGYEKMADDIINQPGHPHRSSLLCNAGKVSVGFNNDLRDIVQTTAANAKRIFSTYLKQPLERGPRDQHLPFSVALPSYEEAFPQGQANMAIFFQQWVRQSHDQNPSQRWRSDWVAVSERMPVNGQAQPAMFYRRDGDLRLVFRFFNGTQFADDTTTFQEYRGGHVNAATAFASCYDLGTEHAALFITNTEGRLFYWEVPKNGNWTKTEVQLPPNSLVRGALCAFYDQRYKKPGAFYRGVEGSLHYVYWNNSKFNVATFSSEAGVGGAISAAWDPRPAGPDGIGHMTATYVRGDGRIHHMYVRDLSWKEKVIPSVTPGFDHHADAQLLASVYDEAAREMVVFWGQVKYELRPVPAEKDLKCREQLLPQLMGTLLDAEMSTITLLKGVSPGKMGITSSGNIMLHLPAYGYRVALEKIRPEWNTSSFRGSIHFHGDNKPTMIDACDSVTKKPIVGFRTKDRAVNIIV